MHFAFGVKKIQKEALHRDRESTNLPFGADNLKLELMEFQIISNLLRQENQTIYENFSLKLNLLC